MRAAPAPPPHRRATGASLAALVLVAVAFVSVLTLHGLRSDIDPVGEVMSSYANGEYGQVMTTAFYAFGLACILLGLRLRTALPLVGASRAVVTLLGAAGLALIAAGAFEVGPPLMPDTVAEVIHSVATMAGFGMIVTTMTLASWLFGGSDEWRSYRPTSITLTLLAMGSAVASPLLSTSPMSGLVQRLLGLAVLAWLLLTAHRIRTNAFAQRP